MRQLGGGGEELGLGYGFVIIEEGGGEFVLSVLFVAFFPCS